MTDIINEYYGVKGVRFLSLLTAALIGFMFVVFFFAIKLVAERFLDQLRCRERSAGYAGCL